MWRWTWWLSTGMHSSSRGWLHWEAATQRNPLRGLEHPSISPPCLRASCIPPTWRGWNYFAHVFFSEFWNQMKCVARKVFWSGFFISTVMHATHATIITTKCTTRPQTSLLEIKFKLFTGKTTPAGKVREIFTGQVCRRAAINAAFSLSNVHSNDSFLKRLFV